jgi:hypothetical protein
MASTSPNPNSGGVERLLQNTKRAQQRGGILLDDRPSLLKQGIAGIRRGETRGMNLDFVTDSANDRILMTFRARVAIKQWAKTILRLEDAPEYLLSLIELRALLPSEVRQRFAQRRWLR